MTAIAIQTQNLTRDFETVRAVDRLEITVDSGMVFGFLGPNGSGKTTTIRLLLGLLEPTDGGAEVLGFDIRTQAGQIRQCCGALLEHNGLYERLSAEDNLDFYARVWHISKTERQARIRELLTHLGLWNRRQENVGNWSRGMKQKLAIARTLLHRPQLVFLDEPTAGLDPVAAAALRDDLASLAEREGVTIFLTTHNLSEAEKLCEQVGVIREGKLLACGPLDQLRGRAAQPRIQIAGRGFSPEILDQLKSQPGVTGVSHKNGTLTINLAEQMESSRLVSLLVGAGAEVEEVQKSKANLEDVFLSLMEEGDQA
jgi:ABC-2 type transport system ATP-binding protein